MTLKLSIILEKSGESLWARIEQIPNYLPTTEGKDVNEVAQNMRGLIQDYLDNEGQHDSFFSGVNVSEIEFEYLYDLEAFFDTFSTIKITNIAAIAGINPGLLRQYASGVKQASESQVKKIEVGIHKLGRALLDVHLV